MKKVCLESNWYVVSEDGTEFNSEQLYRTGGSSLQAELINSFDGEILRRIRLESDCNDLTLVFNKLVLKTKVSNPSVSQSWFIIDDRLNRKFSAKPNSISLMQL